MEVEWDPRKAESNLEKHGIDFEDAIGIFEGPVLEIRSDRDGEERYKAIGILNGLGDGRDLHAERRALPHHLGEEGDEA